MDRYPGYGVLVVDLLAFVGLAQGSFLDETYSFSETGGDDILNKYSESVRSCLF